MRNLGPALAGVAMILIATGVQAEASGATTDSAGEIDAEAMDALKELADYLGSTDTFSFHAEYSFDVVQDSGAKVEFGSSRHTLVSRPNKMRVESQRRDGLKSVVIFDGDNIWAFAPEPNVYAQADQPGDLDESIDFAAAELRMKAPMAELVSPDLYQTLQTNLTHALYLGETVVAGVQSEHLLLSNDYADFQMWIATGDQPLLQRVVITYREEPGEPQFRAQFLDWDMSPTDTTGKFSFQPPDGAERVRFYVSAPPTDLDKEDAS